MSRSSAVEQHGRPDGAAAREVLRLIATATTAFLCAVTLCGCGNKATIPSKDYIQGQVAKVLPPGVKVGAIEVDVTPETGQEAAMIKFKATCVAAEDLFQRATRSPKDETLRTEIQTLLTQLSRQCNASSGDLKQRSDEYSAATLIGQRTAAGAKEIIYGEMSARHMVDVWQFSTPSLQTTPFRGKFPRSTFKEPALDQAQYQKKGQELRDVVARIEKQRPSLRDDDLLGTWKHHARGADFGESYETDIVAMFMPNGRFMADYYITFAQKRKQKKHDDGRYSCDGHELIMALDNGYEIGHYYLCSVAKSSGEIRWMTIRGDPSIWQQVP